MRLLVPALLIGDHPRKVQGVDILRIETQSVRVRRFGFAEAPRLVMLQPIAGALVRRSASCAWRGIGLGRRLCGSLEPIQHQGSVELDFFQIGTISGATKCIVRVRLCIKMRESTATRFSCTPPRIRSHRPGHQTGMTQAQSSVTRRQLRRRPEPRRRPQ